MILSMTGFGDAHLEAAGRVYHLEIRTVNNRYFKTAIHLPEEFGFLEAEVERQLRQRLTRGSVTVRLHVRAEGEDAAVQINSAVVRSYVQQLKAAASDASGTTIDLAAIAALPGVIEPPDLSDEERAAASKTINSLIESALERLIAMRTAEGRALAADLRTHCQRVAEHLNSVKGRSRTVVDEYRKRLLTRVQELIADSGVRLAEEDLLKEVSIYAERSDVSEELSRLTGHLEQFSEFLTSREPTGRKLDFLSQEMLREANTIGSKASDAQIARDIIEIKSAIDRIKEQVQNAE